MLYVGIDPGIHGAIAFRQNGSLVSVHDMPVYTTTMNAKVMSKGKKTKKHKVRTHTDFVGLATLLDNASKDCSVRVALEKVGVMANEGALGAFSFGCSYGGIKGVLSGLFLTYAEAKPQAWKSFLSVPADKDAARQRATDLMPDCAKYWPLKKHDGRAEAALIALYGEQVLFK